mmetsp:Transcript_40662/g.115897  ORF Transcript_40662/g.115897 Transcript_40662/m.115897 type:complete len:224 (-) Transcript_40662:187-858(-)
MCYVCFAGLPGLGPPDVYYPASWLGKWERRESVVSVTAPEGPSKVDPPHLLSDAEKLLNRTIVFPVRYIERGSGVVMDRAFVWGNTESARRYCIESGGGGVLPIGEVSGYPTRWSESNPNILTIDMPGGTIREMKVTKRAFEQPSDDTFGFSEYMRIADTSRALTVEVPTLFAARLQGRYRRVSSLRIEGLELWQVFPPTSIAPDPQPVLVIKRQVAMQRITT